VITGKAIAVACLAVVLAAGASGAGTAEKPAAFGTRKWRFVATPEEADARVEIRECVVRVRSRASSKVKQTPIDVRGPSGHRVIPGGGAVATGGEQEYGAGVEEERLVLLVVRLSMGERFADVSSDPRDERLKQAARTVAKEAEKWLADARSSS
jgi:hypothetical protein